MKISKIIPIGAFILITFLSIIFLDLNQSREYVQLKNYKYDYIYIPYTSEDIFDTLLKIKKVADDNNMILAKDVTKDSKRNIYLSVNTSDELLKILTSNLKIKKINNGITDKNSFISTKYTGDFNQIAYIADFLANDDYTYYTFYTLEDSGEPLFGSYIVYYKDDNDLVKFKSNIGDIIETDNQNINIKFNNTQKYFLGAIVIIIIIILLLYYIFQIFNIFNNSKNISCMKLLGYSNLKILNMLEKKYFILYDCILIIMFVILTIFLKNFTIKNILFLIIINVTILILSYLLNFCSLFYIFKKSSLVNILKEKNISNRVKKINDVFKIIVVSIMLIFVSIFVIVLHSLNESLSTFTFSKDLLNYMIIYGVDNELEFTEENNKKTNEFYNLILSDKNLNTFYSHFSSYFIEDEESIKQIELDEKEGSFYRYGTVDINYIVKENIKIYDDNNNLVSVNDLPSNFFLFPKSRKHEVENFSKFYNNEIYPNYKHCNIDIEFLSYYYDDQKLNTYTIYSDMKYIESPIIRVANQEIYMNYIINSMGLSIFGNGFTTGLKIEINQDKEKIYRTLEEYVERTGLSNNISSNNFLYYRDYFNDEIRISKTILLMIMLFLIIMFITYISISYQTINLFFKAQKQDIIVKKFLGFDNFIIFKKEIIKNFVQNLIGLFLALIIMFFVNVVSILYMTIISVLFLLLDLFIIIVIIESVNKKSITKCLKGGFYD